MYDPFADCVDRYPLSDHALHDLASPAFYAQAMCFVPPSLSYHQQRREMQHYIVYTLFTLHHAANAVGANHLAESIIS